MRFRAQGLRCVYISLYTYIYIRTHRHRDSEEILVAPIADCMVMICHHAGTFPNSNLMQRTKPGSQHPKAK